MAGIGLKLKKFSPGAISGIQRLGLLVDDASRASIIQTSPAGGLVGGPKKSSTFPVLQARLVNVTAPSLSSSENIKTHLISAIKAASDQGTAMEAIAKIGEWWSILDDATGLAEGRTRLLLKKVKAPLLATEPTWVAEQVRELSSAEDDSAPSHPKAIDSARRIIRACLARVGGDVKYSADLRRGPLGRVAISWDLDGGHLHWIVTAADLPWPGVLVHSVVVSAGSKPSARIHHFVGPVIEEFVGLTRRAA